MFLGETESLLYHFETYLYVLRLFTVVVKFYYDVIVILSQMWEF